VNPLAVAFSIVLACAAVLAALLVSRARPSSRDYLRLAAALYFSLALCAALAAIYPGAMMLGFSVAVTQVVGALAPVTLAFALFATFEHPPSAWIAGISMVLACIAGIAAAAVGKPVLSLAPLAVSALAMFALCFRRWRVEKRSASHAFLSVCCLICAAAASLGAGEGARIALILFSAAALLGFALALARRSGVAVVNARDLRMAVSIGDKR
jgi:hypothetical protein